MDGRYSAAGYYSAAADCPDHSLAGWVFQAVPAEYSAGHYLAGDYYSAAADSRAVAHSPGGCNPAGSRDD
jgi:hypothetical protein